MHVASAPGHQVSNMEPEQENVHNRFVRMAVLLTILGHYLAIVGLVPGDLGIHK